MFEVLLYGSPSIERTRCAHAGILLGLTPRVPLVWPRASPNMSEVKRVQYCGKRKNEATDRERRTNERQNIRTTPGRKMPRSSTRLIILSLRCDRSQSRRRPRWQEPATGAAAALENERQKLCSRKQARIRLGRFEKSTRSGRQKPPHLHSNIPNACSM